MNNIPTFDECLHVCEENSGFSHSVQEIHGKEVHSFKYNFQSRFNEMYKPFLDKGINALAMRGITFIDGKLVAIGPDKFFNLGENETAVYPENERYLMEKVDGSLISVFQVDHLLEIKTQKSVFSEVAKDARKYFNTRNDLQGFSMSLLSRGLSPFFEYVGPHNRIVLRYDEEDFVFLGARCLISGTMVFPWDMFVPSTITIPQLIAGEGKDAYLERDDVEGLVVVGDCGHMVKMKTSTYCQLHKILDMKTPKSFCEYYIAHGNFDDVIGVLTHHGLTKDIADLVAFEDDYIEKVESHNQLISDAVKKYGHLSRKGVALKMIDDKVDNALRGLVFSTLDGKDTMPKIQKLILEGYKDAGRREED